LEPILSSKNGKLREFGEFRLDPVKLVLWFRDQPVNLPLKEVELLSALTANAGEVMTKAELLDSIWKDSFVEESNLSRHVYILRKTFKEFGVGDLIETVPRRGYRFVGSVRDSHNETSLIVERHVVAQTTIEDISDETDVLMRESRGLIDRFLLSRSLTAAAATLASILVIGLIAGFAAWWNQIPPFASSSGSIRSVAVFPFAQLDQGVGSKQQGVGLADTLITRLSNLRSIRVSSFTAVVGLDGRDPVAAGKLLDVDAVLVGTIYRSGDKTRVSARILKVSDGKAIWTGEFERLATEDLRMQNDLALQVTNALAPNLDPDEKNKLAKSYTEDPDAFRLYQEARFEWNKRNTQGATDASRLFREAIAKDPKFALAYTGLAEVVATMNAVEAEAIAHRAIELDPDLAEAHGALGFIHTFVHRNWEAAEKELTRSIDLNPNYAQAHHWYAELLAILGRNAEAKIEINRALEIDPLSHNFRAALGQIYYFNREYQEAESHCRRALELDPNFVFAHEYLADIYLQTGEFEKAVDARLTAQRINERFSVDSDERIKAHDSTIDEKRELALRRGINEFLKGLLSESADPAVTYYDARRYAELGNKDMALDALERSVHGRAFHTAFVKVDPVFDRIREEARYKQVLRNMNLLDTNN
jgi:DNA-binding winged helix-turn-helix (wHTH) protein/TolB-like protein/Tfp pilus assembly protein PilF